MSPSMKKAWGTIALLALAALLWWAEGRGTAAPERRTPPAAEGRDPNEELLRAHREGRKGAWVQGRARVARVLDDDRDPPRHQRFLVTVGDGLSVKISHNVDLAPRVPRLAPGMEVGYHGRYDLGEHGPLVHWTHRDPQGRHAGGWLEVSGTTYR